MTIGIDAMGGDHAPEAAVSGAILARRELPGNIDLALIGDEKNIKDICAANSFDAGQFKIVHAAEVIGMGEAPVKAIASKTKSSINIGFHLLQAGEIEGFTSAGNTGAMLVGALYSVKQIPGIIRPVIASVVPQPQGPPKLILDVGINTDSKPDVLYQWAILGSIYAENIFNIAQPKVALLNIGEEEEKGNLLTKSAYQMMKDTTEFNFAGNIEANHLFESNNVDVVVCDGFVGNVVLKLAESFYTLSKMRKMSDAFMDKFNFEQYGGTPILGINKTVTIGHGMSNDIAIKNMIFQTRDIIEKNISDKIKNVLN